MWFALRELCRANTECSVYAVAHDLIIAFLDDFSVLLRISVNLSLNGNQWVRIHFLDQSGIHDSTVALAQQAKMYLVETMCVCVCANSAERSANTDHSVSKYHFTGDRFSQNVFFNGCEL